jgi:SAM-dependent methyltransferase
MTQCHARALRLFATVFLSAAFSSAIGQAPKDNDAGPYVPTPWPIVDELLKLADIKADDVVYDLGSGDGRLVLTAARRFGARGVGIELQKKLVDQANAEAAREGLGDRVRFVQQDLFEARFGEASVVTLYLLPRFVTRLVPRLRAELRPGSRIVAHDYPLNPWPADRTLSFEVDEKVPITGSRRTVLYYYIVPARVGGEWDLALPRGLLAEPAQLRLRQEVDSLEGTVRLGGGTTDARDLSVRGDRIRFGLLSQGRLLSFTGTVTSNTMQGEVSVSGTARRESWSAKLRSPSP